jgi:hypothetical protein
MAGSITRLVPLVVPRNLKATRIDPKAEGDVGLPARSYVIDKTTQISVQREDASGKLNAVGQVTLTGEPTLIEVSARDNPADAVFIDKARAAYQTDGEIGVPTLQRSVTTVGGAMQPIAGGGAVPVLGRIPVKENAAPQIASAPPIQAPVIEPPVTRAKCRVKLSNPTMGRHTITVRAVAISPTLVVLAYPSDAENIIEPPVCGSDNAITVEYGEARYKCVFGGWTAELENSFLIVLIRLDEKDATG